MHCDKCYGAFTPGPRSPAGLRGINLARAQSSLQEKRMHGLKHHRTDDASITEQKVLEEDCTEPNHNPVSLHHTSNF